MSASLLRAEPSLRDAQWIVPTPLARDRVARDLASAPWRSARASGPRVRCWDDLWRWAAGRAAKAPTILSESAATAVFDQALRDETAAGRRGPIAELTSRAGYRRRLRRRIAEWTAAERHRDPEWHPAGPDGDETIAAAERSTFLRYRRLLAGLGAEDEAGLAVWASLLLRDDPRTSADGDHIVFFGFDGRTPARWRILRDALERPRTIDVILCHHDDPGRAELFLAAGSVRGRLLELGLSESRIPSCPERPPGLRAVDARLFGPSGTLIEDVDGLSIRGGPAGMDLGRMVAREAKALLEARVPPDEILVVFPRRDEQADAVVEAMRGAGIPVADAGVDPLDRDPAVAAVLQAARLPLEDWEVEQVVRLLRNGQLRPDWAGVDRLSLAEAASTLRDLTVFRGKDQILNALARAIARTEDGPNEAEARRRREKVARADRAHGILASLIGAIGNLNRPRPWAEHVAGLRRAVESLGIGRDDPQPLETLWDALEDRAEIFDRLGRGAVAAPWEDFVEELTDVAAETPRPRPAPPPGAIRAVEVDEMEGVCAWHLLVVGLAEGTFPRRPSVQRFLAIRPGVAPDDDARRVYSAEALRFACMLGGAGRGVGLFYPTTDAKGQPLLRAGFLDDLLNSLTPAADSACHVAHARFHPALIDRDDLAIAPTDARVLAVARAAESGRLGPLRSLARDPAHRDALDGAAAAMVALERRRKGTPFGPFEGLLGDPGVLAPLSELFDATRHVFSPSQLETYLNCPFQFFCRHVLKLEPIAERDELDEDYTARGSLLHDILEKFEKRRAEADASIADALLLDEALDEVLPLDEDGLGEMESALRVIERGQVARAVALYVRQRAEYHAGAPAAPAPTWFEFGFGEPGLDHPEPYEVRLGDRVAKLKGRIDRIDVIESPSSPRFRVIDYKSGTPPSGKDVTEYRMLQLPLYAMAVGELLYGEGRGELMDVGYWGLKDKGYRPIVFPEWTRARDELLEQVFAVIRSIQGGAFQIAPRQEGCEKYCEYRVVCRIRQVRLAGKLEAPAGGPPRGAARGGGESGSVGAALP
jgi:ATP-dependent helicase/nuclease subunit B